MKFFLSKYGENRTKKISTAKVKEMVGEQRFKKIKREAIETYKEDPGISIEYMVSEGRLIIEVTPQ